MRFITDAFFRANYILTGAPEKELFVQGCTFLVRKTSAYFKLTRLEKNSAIKFEEELDSPFFPKYFVR